MLLRILLSNGRGLCQSFLCGFNMQVFDNFTINNCDTLPRFFNFFEGFDLTAGQIQLCCTWGETFIRHGNLGGMDQCFSVKTQITALFSFCAQALFVFELVIHSIDGDHVIATCRQQHHLQRHLHRQTIGARAAIQFFGQIVCSRHEPL